MANTNKKMVDLPFFELCNQAPTAASAVAAMTSCETGDDRYIYYISTSAFYRYDTVGDTFQQLPNPATAPVTFARMRYTTYRGYHGRVITANSTSVLIPGLRGNLLSNTNITILQGTGVGQNTNLTFSREIVYDAGVITGTTTSSLADSTKKWEPNVWAGYTVAITFGTDVTQYKKVLYNDTTTLYIADANLQPHIPWDNQIFVAASPYAVPVTTAGSQAHYQIMASEFNVSPSWTTTPDSTSFFTTNTGGMYLLSSSASAPFFTLQYYDVLGNSWQTKTVPQSLIGAAFGTDAAIERLGKFSGPYVTKVGTVSSTNRTLTDSGLALEKGRYENHRIVITGGTGMGQHRRIVGHTATTFTIPKNWDINPDNTSTYEIWADYDRVYVGGNASAALYAYSPENDLWMQGQLFDDGITANISCTMKGWTSLGVSTGTRIAAGITSISATPSAGGSGYTIGDILTCAVGGAGAQVIVTSISAGGVVTGLKLVHSGTSTGYTVSSGNALTGGTGTSCTLNITGVGATALITLASAHWFKSGEKVTFAGCTEAAWNAEYTIIGVNGTTSFSVACPSATSSMAATASQSTSVIVDPSKSWIANEHVGRLVHLCVAGQAPTSQIRWIISNTPTTLTVATIVAGVNGTSKYCIYDSKVFGCDEQRRESDKKSYGYATSGNTTTLVDSTKNWIPNQWTNYTFKIETGTGYGSGRISITTNSANTLSFTSQSFSPDTTSKYVIADTWGLCTAGGTTTPVTEATTKNWVTNYWAGKRFRITGGTAPGQETTITSSTATALTSAALTATDATSTYAILSIPARGTGIELIWNWGVSDSTVKGRYMYFPRGSGSNTFDIYDIPSGKWLFGYFFNSQGELFTTGSSYAYNGGDIIYMSRSTTSVPIRIFEYNVLTNEIKGTMTTTWLQGTAHIGNFMEVVESPDGTLQYIYCLQNTGTLLSRGLIF